MASKPINPAEVFIDHALGLEWAALPARTQTAAKAFLYDTICVGVAGAKAPYGEALGAVVKSWGEGGGCLVLGRPGWRLPAPSAAFLNAFQIHAQEYDCVHEKAVAHPMATVTAALLAEAHRSGPYSGADFAAAVVAGVDVVAGLGVAASTPLKFFRPATAGIFGSVAALARLKRMARETALDAFGYALAFASGTMQAHVEGKPALPVQVANAARGAIAAVDIAQAGLGGPRHVLDGPFGYLTLSETAFELEPVLAELGQTFRIDEVSWKPFPTGRAAQGGIVAIQTLMREAGLTADNLASLTYKAPPLIKRLVGRPAIDAMGPAHARLCLPWLAAVTLTRGTVGLDDFTAASLTDPALLALSKKVAVEDNGNLDPATFAPAQAVAAFTDGREARVDVARQFGSPLWPLTRKEQIEKGAACLAFAGLSERHEGLVAAFEVFETLADASAAVSLAC
jgi:2-methylcitrate dehydratase PrpD